MHIGLMGQHQPQEKKIKLKKNTKKKVCIFIRFAQGGNALFEGKVAGSPKPQVLYVRLIVGKIVRKGFENPRGQINFQRCKH